MVVALSCAVINGFKMTGYEIAEQRIAEAKERKESKLDLRGLGLTYLLEHIVELTPKIIDTYC